MESLYLHLFALLFLSLAGACLGSSPTELHWKSAIPDTQMPKSLKNLIRYDKEGVDKMVRAGKDPRDNLSLVRLYATDESTLENMMKASKDARDHNTFLPGISKDMYFFEKDLHPGRKIQVQLQKTPIGDITFLPDQVAERMPFSSGKFPEILEYFSVKADSVEANIMKETIDVCEKPAVGGEDKFCATSLESLVDTAVLKLGKGVQVLSSEVEKETQSEEFTILEGVKLMGENEVVCHKLKYPYAVFYCHSIDKTAAYGVPMVASDGTRARAIAVCHKDTSSWNPNHVSFKLLKVKPGTVPICHFLFRETLVWLPSEKMATGTSG